MEHNMITVKLDDAIIHIPHKTVVRNFIDSINPKPKPAANSIPGIGDIWIGQGGINAGLMRGVNGQPDYWLIASIDPAGHLNPVEWGSEGKEEPGANCEYDGLANTKSLTESEHRHEAAEKIAALTIDGHSDFYLPARRELSLLYANVPELFEKDWHWSSTQYSPVYAWDQYFSSGYQHGTVKESRARARAVRRLII